MSYFSIACGGIVEGPLTQLPVPTHLVFITSRVHHISHPHRYPSDSSRIAVDAKTLALHVSPLVALEASPGVAVPSSGHAVAAKTVSPSGRGFCSAVLAFSISFVIFASLESLGHSLFPLHLLHWVSFRKALQDGHHQYATRGAL